MGKRGRINDFEVLKSGLIPTCPRPAGLVESAAGAKAVTVQCITPHPANAIVPLAPSDLGGRPCYSAESRSAAASHPLQPVHSLWCVCTFSHVDGDKKGHLRAAAAFAGTRSYPAPRSRYAPGALTLTRQSTGTLLVSQSASQDKIKDRGSHTLIPFPPCAQRGQE